MPLYADTGSDYTYVRNGVLYGPDGKELSLWGVNFQPCLKWEYNDKLLPEGYPETWKTFRSVIDNNIDDIRKMGVSVIRCHLTPADFTDSSGNLAETPYLQALDYMVAESAKRKIYVTLTFVNLMGQGYCMESVFNSIKKEDLIFRQDIATSTRNYIRQLLTRKNRYTGHTYASEPAIAYWEIINEPLYFDYDEIKADPQAGHRYLSWLQQENLEDNKNSFALFREKTVKEYIDEMCLTVKNSGARQPVSWCMNWHKFRQGNEDIFNGVATSSADIVSICNYPGQDIAGPEYYNNPIDLTSTDFADWFRRYYEMEDGYGWICSEQFASKAKVVYEFETFFNQSAYLYPIQALYFRTLGIQSAAMWTYTIKEAAINYAGSHFLNLDCTPQKAASFIVAHEIFSKTPRATALNENLNEQFMRDFVISRKHDACIWSDKSKLYYSKDISEWHPIEIHNDVKEIVGIGNSPLVEYSGTGIYFIEDTGDTLHIEIRPDHKWINDPWNSKIKHKKKTSELGYNSTNRMTINLKDWQTARYSVYRQDGKKERKIMQTARLDSLQLYPGKYIITR